MTLGRSVILSEAQVPQLQNRLMTVVPDTYDRYENSIGDVGRALVLINWYT